MLKTIVLINIVLFTINSQIQSPIIGVYTSKSHHEFYEDLSNQHHNTSYVAASYVKFIQMSGAQVVPILAYTKDQAYFDNLLKKINGVLFPGGREQININNTWTKNADYILKYAQNKSDPFPIWGTCRGWQLLAYLTSGYDPDLLTNVTGQENITNNISIQSPSYLFDGISQNLTTSLQNGNGIVFFHHVKAVSTDYYENNTKFKDFWRIASTTISSNNITFISTAQSKQYPIYATQFHPEKNLFQWKVLADRSDDGAEVVHILSTKFIKMARSNKNRFDSNQQFYEINIQNYPKSNNSSEFTLIYHNIRQDTQQLDHQNQLGIPQQQKGLFYILFWYLLID